AGVRRDHVGYEQRPRAYLRRECQLDPINVVRQLHEERGRTGSGNTHVSDIMSRPLVNKSRAGPISAERFEPEVATVGVCRLPHLDRGRRINGADVNRRTEIADVPAETGQRGAVEQGLLKTDRAHNGVCIQAVVGVGNVADVVLSGKVVEVELGRIGDEELIARRIDEVLRYAVNRPVEVLKRVDDLSERLSL